MLNPAIRDLYFNSSLQISRACNQIIELTDNEDAGSNYQQMKASIMVQLELIKLHVNKMSNQTQILPPV